MARTVASLSVSINASTRGLQRGLRNASSMVSKFRSDVTALAGRMARLGAGIAAVGGGAVAFGIGRAIKSLSDLGKTADKLSIDPTPLVALRDAAQQSGVEVKTFDMGLQRMLRRIQEASRGTGEAKQTLIDLGLSAKDLARLKPEEQFARIAEAMADTSDEGLSLARAMKLFDSEGVALLNTLRLVNEKGLGTFIKDVENSGRALDRDAIRPMEEVEDRIFRLGNRFSGIFVKLAESVAPVLNNLLGRMEKFLNDPKTVEDMGRAFDFMSSGIERAGNKIQDLLEDWRSLRDETKGFLAFGQDVKNVTGAIGTVIGGAAAATAANFSGGNIAGTPGRAIFDQALEDATRLLGDTPKRLDAAWDSIVDTLGEWGSALRRGTDDVIDSMTGRRSGGFFTNETTGAKTSIGNEEAVTELRKQSRLLEEQLRRDPRSLPPGTMLIRVEG